MYNLQSLIVIINGYFLLSCTYSIEYPYKSTSNKIVINCILYPDSIVNLSLSYPSNYPSENDTFTIVNDAEVKFYENSNFIDILIFDYETNIYKLDFKPAVGNTYSISILLPGHEEVFAHTYIPDEFIFEACYQPLMQNQYLNEIKSNLSSLQHDESYWIYFLSDDYVYYKDSVDDRTIYSPKSGPLISFIYSYDRIFDDFNSLFWKDGSQQYANVLRLPHLGYDFYSYSVYSTSSALWPNSDSISDFQKNRFKMIVVKASKEADLYWKSVFLNHANKNFSIPNPFYEPVIVPSNIVNGTGVFAGVNSKFSYAFNNPCD